MTSRPPLDTDALSVRLRERGVDVPRRAVLLSVLAGTGQELDLSEPTNCDGLGRVRHFQESSSPGWPANTLPARPARDHLGPTVGSEAELRAQVFQNAVCNWRCWYCYVPFSLLKGDPRHSRWMSVEDMVDAYLALPSRPPVLDLSGGQPELVPEWVVWTLEALDRRGASDEVYVWSDDNLSNDYTFRHLSSRQLDVLGSYRGYGRVGCFKGFDAASFAFNTRAAPELFDRQFELFRRLQATGMDLWAYVTLTTPELPRAGSRRAIATFVDRLQAVDERLPWRTVPLEVSVFTPTARRMGAAERAALKHQQHMVEAWCDELEQRGERPA